MNLPPQSRIAMLLAIYLLLGFLLAIVIVETQSITYVVVFFIWFIVANFLLNNVKCPRCRQSIIKQESATENSFLARVLKPKCLNCGRDLTRWDRNWQGEEAQHQAKEQHIRSTETASDASKETIRALTRAK